MFFLLKLEITVCLYWLALKNHLGSLKRIDYQKQICLVQPLSFYFFTALKGTHFFYIFLIKNPHSSIVQIIFYFWSFEIMEYILRTRK